METRCIHELAMGECAHCKEIPFGMNAIVFRTTFGKAFHNWDNCEDLESGQKFAESKGGSPTEIFGITYSAGSQELYPCEWCCALYYSKGLNLEDCIVTLNSREKPAKIVKDRYLSKNLRRYQIYFPESNEIEITTSRYVKRFK
jgi:hypothetical protein